MTASSATRARDEITPEHVLLGHSPRVQALAARLRELVRATVPDAGEKAYPVWRGIGYRHPECGYFCGIFPQENSVRLLFERGALLPDPDGLLEGTGKQTRYVDIRRQQYIRVRPIKRLIKAALAYRKR